MKFQLTSSKDKEFSQQKKIQEMKGLLKKYYNQVRTHTDVSQDLESQSSPPLDPVRRRLANRLTVNTSMTKLTSDNFPDNSELDSPSTAKIIRKLNLLEEGSAPKLNGNPMIRFDSAGLINQPKKYESAHNAKPRSLFSRIHDSSCQALDKDLLDTEGDEELPRLSVPSLAMNMCMSSFQEIELKQLTEDESSGREIKERVLGIRPIQRAQTLIKVTEENSPMANILTPTHLKKNNTTTNDNIGFAKTVETLLEEESKELL